MPLGQMAPAQLYAHMARRHMEMFGTKSEHFGKIAVTVREHATMNDNALMTEPLTLDQHQTARMISDQLRLFDCFLESDGGAAVAVSSSERARAQQSPPQHLMASGTGR